MHNSAPDRDCLDFASPNKNPDADPSTADNTSPGTMRPPDNNGASSDHNDAEPVDNVGLDKQVFIDIIKNAILIQGINT